MSTIKKTFSVRETSKLIKFPGGEIKFYKWLRRMGFCAMIMNRINYIGIKSGLMLFLQISTM